MDVARLAHQLICVPTITPDDGSGVAMIASLLQPLGFECEIVSFGEGASSIPNLFACYPSREALRHRHFAFAGHSDVVPAGELSAWRHPPFDGVIEDGVLHGRGAVDMKGGIACFIAAAVQWREEIKEGGISMLITGDEEGEAEFGTKALMAWLQQKDLLPDVCLIGEPSSATRVGDQIRVGRRGSVRCECIITGTQGHSAYPHLAKNPLHCAADMMGRFCRHDWDANIKEAIGDAPTILTFTHCRAEGEASNVTPLSAQVRFNVRHHPSHDVSQLVTAMERSLDELCGDGFTYELTHERASEAFVSDNKAWHRRIVSIIERRIGVRAQETMGGGTSDGRFISKYCPVVELGLVGTTMHSTEERTSLVNLSILVQLYYDILADFFTKKQ